MHEAKKKHKKNKINNYPIIKKKSQGIIIIEIKIM